MKFFVSATIAACAFASTLSFADAMTDAKTKFFDLINKDSVTVDFKEGSSAISKAEDQDINAVVAAVKKDTTVSKVIVAAWADKEYPEDVKANLSAADQKLADTRAAKVKKALEAAGVKNVETHTMASHPTWIARTFNTDDSKVKGEGTVTDANDKLVTEIGKTLRDKGGPGKAVVLVRRSGDTSTH